jgi:hypothetical protein
VTASFNGRALPTVQVNGVPTLYPLLTAGQLQHGVLALSVSPGVRAYDFTFG